MYPGSTAEIIDIKHQKLFRIIGDLNKDSEPIIAVIVHLRRCASVLSALDPSIPVLAVCGGTDLNEDIRTPDYLRQMTESVARSRAVVVFAPFMLKKFEELWPSYPGLVEIIPQVVRVDEVLARKNLSIHRRWLEEQVGCKMERFFIIAGRLRPVKAPEFALTPFLEWNSEPLMPSTGASGDNDWLFKPHHHHLVYIGSVEEDTPSIQSFLSSLTSSHVHHVNSVDRECLHSLMLASDGLINCSISEGQSLTNMEAMTLGTAVLARANPGNCDLIRHNETGLIFSSPQELKLCLTRIACEQNLRRRLVESAYNWIHQPAFQPCNQIVKFRYLFSRLCAPNSPSFPSS
ncbi:Glycosyltransferase 1 domain-containing protein 1, variant 2 [Clonorchis sinensis]|nr:Glycosyltransferase 1 domain-containing protein 1, variant 2 [Clonorchis sinensis]